MNQKNLDTIKHFLGFCKKELEIQSLPNISLVRDKSFVERSRSFGEYNPNGMSIRVFTTGRNLADICRSLAHELVHHRQHELGLIYNAAGETGTEIENDANSIAGILMREYGKLNLSVYDLDSSGIKGLAEGKQVGTLYHFTSYTSLIKIIKSDFVLTTTQTDIQPYVSFTRNKKFQSDTISTQARLTIDGDQLSNKYKITPHADTKAGYGRGSQDEAEERISLVKYPNGVDVSRYLIEVTLRKINTAFDWEDPDSFQDTEDFVEPPSLESYNEVLKLLKDNGIPYKIVDRY
jgi:hypothetical protein